MFFSVTTVCYFWIVTMKLVLHSFAFLAGSLSNINDFDDFAISKRKYSLLLGRGSWRWVSIRLNEHKVCSATNEPS